MAVLKAVLATAGLGAGPSDTYLLPIAVSGLTAALFAAAGLYLAAMSGRDPRALPLGVLFLLVGSAFTDRLLHASAASGSPLAPVLNGLAVVPVDAYLPFFFWAFVRDFPRRARQWRGGGQWAIRTSFAVGTLLFLANLAGSVAGLRGTAPPLLLALGKAGLLYWLPIFGLMLPALPFALWRARRASRNERRRVAIMLAGLIIGFAPITLIIVLAGLSSDFSSFATRPSGMQLLWLVVYPPLLSVPLVTAYAVLVHEALDIRLLVRRALRYALARQTILLLALLPFLALLSVFYAQRDRPLIDIFTGWTGIGVASGLLVGVATMRSRGRLLEALDRRFFREQYDARMVLSALVERIRALGSREELAEVLAREIDVALHLQLAELLLLDPASGALVPVKGAIRPLPKDSDLARRLTGAPGALEVDWGRPALWLTTLAEAEQHWVADSSARLLIPILRADGSPAGLIVLGEKLSELPFSTEDRLLLQAIAGSVSLVLESHRFDAASAGGWMTGASAAASAPARECTGCGEIARGGPARCGQCGEPTAPAAVPELLAGKFFMLRCAGRGGMGVIYRAVDLSLERDVAVKTLPRMAAGDAAQLRREARTMAAVQHPHLALIFGAESWQGVPMLVVEFLPGGTLADRLHPGPLPLDEALHLGTALASALECLHGAGILHRDIKPSNIGFTADGSAKLLDFGISQFVEGMHRPPPRGIPGAAEPRDPLVSLARGPHEVAGTIAYLSPEAARGGPPEPSWDLWSLAMVLYEAIAGRHPFTHGSAHWVLAQIVEAAVPDIRELAPGVPGEVAGLFREALASDPRRRPATGRDLRLRLERLRHSLEREPARPHPSLV